MKPTTATSAGPTTSSRFAHLGDDMYGMLPVAWAPKMRGLKVIVFWILCAHANEDGICFPSRKTIARLAGIHVSHVTPALRELEAMGAIETAPAVGHSSHYRIMPPPPYKVSSNSDKTPPCEVLSELDNTVLPDLDKGVLSESGKGGLSESDNHNRPGNIPMDIFFNKPADAPKKNGENPVEKRNDDRLRAIPKPPKPTQPLNAEAVARANAIRTGQMKGTA